MIALAIPHGLGSKLYPQKRSISEDFTGDRTGQWGNLAEHLL
jgi:hypothetical protein